MPKVQTPEIKLPDVKLPKLPDKIGDVKMPDLKLGNLKLPRLSFESSNAIKQAKKRLPGQQNRPSLVSIVAGAIGGAALFYFLDPERGATRRAQAAAQISATVRRLSGNLSQIGNRASSNANGFSQKMIHLRSGSAPVDDLTLRDRVESEVFRDSSLPKGRLNLDVESGVVTIRGQVENAYEIASIEKAVLKVRGVNGVENLMHVQGSAAPNKVEARETAR
ncbi:MAG: BON domain-containing protein [Candidatus Dormibacteraeota bacterium]|nr:BON domain-containing protein [Candidatus Dormibacteraeota bacterium]